MYRILIAEDDKDIAELIRLYMVSEGYEILMAEDGQAAWEMFQQNEVHLAIVDIMMPRMNGYDLTKNIRSLSNIPIVILSAKNSNLDKIVGFNNGADMYLTKPFDPMELAANVKAALRRYYQLGGADTYAQPVAELHYRDLILDTRGLNVRKGTETIPLTATEIRILALLMQHPGKVFTKEQIAESIRSDFVESDARTIAVHISNMRHKLEDDSANPRYIRSVRGLGYKMERL